MPLLTTHETGGKGLARNLMIGSVVMGVLAYGANKELSGDDSPSPVHTPNIAEKVLKTGEVPEGYALKTIFDGETPDGIAKDFGAKDQSEVSDQIRDQIGNETGLINSGETVLLKVDDFKDAYVSVTNVPTGQQVNGVNQVAEMPFLFSPPESNK